MLTFVSFLLELRDDLNIDSVLQSPGSPALLELRDDLNIDSAL